MVLRKPSHKQLLSFRARTGGAFRFTRPIGGVEAIPRASALATAGIAAALLLTRQGDYELVSLGGTVLISSASTSAGSDFAVSINAVRISDNLTRDFNAERTWFNRNRLTLRAEYSDRYVAVHGQAVVDSDPILAALVNRFFATYGPVEAYFGFVGREPAGVVAGL